jgi:hypothetical protein
LISPSAAGSWASQSLSVFSGVSSVSTRHAEEAGNCGSGAFITEEVDGVGEKGLGDTTMIDVKTLLPLLLDFGLFSSTAKVSGLKEY